VLVVPAGTYDIYVLGINGLQMRHVSIHDPFDGAEGVLGAGLTYIIPETSSAALLGLLAVGMMIRISACRFAR
jgi:hypothetical protein